MPPVFDRKGIIGDSDRNGFVRNLSLNQVLVLLILVLAALVGIQVADAVFARRGMIELGGHWQEYRVDRSDRARLSSALRGALGFGGFIHNYSDLILRKDHRFYDAAQQNLGGAQTLINAYLTLDTSPAEETALDDIRRTLNAYQDALAQIERMIDKGTTADEIGRRIQVDDRLALRGLDTLADNYASAGRMTKTQVLDRLRAALGYGGFIHAFKNYVRRGNEKSVETALRAGRAARQAIADYRALGLPPSSPRVPGGPDGMLALEPAGDDVSPEDRFPGLSKGELAALEDIEATLDSYLARLPEIGFFRAEGLTPEGIDRQVRVDDALALRALADLSREINQSLERRSARLADDFQRAVRFENVFYWVNVALIAVGAFLAFWLIRGLVISPLKGLNTTMGRLAEGDVATEIEGLALRNEIGDMARSVKVFKTSMIAARESEQQLRASEEELKAQLHSLEALKQDRENQAATAIGLAENLAAARDAAEKATARAEADELRMRTILDTTTDAMVTIDSDGIIESFNLAAQTIFGWSATEAVGRGISILMPDHLAVLHEKSMRSFDPDAESGVIGHTLELEGKRKDGTTFPVELSVNSMRLGDELKFTGVIRDITERKETEEEIRRLALTDPLTGLANRNQLYKQFDGALALARRRPDWTLATLVLDLDKFKPVNDTLGHLVGDEVLKEVGRVLTRCTRESDIVARLGGDEFVVVLVDAGGLEAVGRVAERIVDGIEAPHAALGHEVRIGASIGIATFPGDGATPVELIARADYALYRAKAALGSGWQFYDRDLDETAAPGEKAPEALPVQG